MSRHQDFEYILGEFKRYYKNDAKAMQEYQAWLKALKLNDEKSYGQARESFQWAKDMITRFKEDATSVYYKVLVGFPTRSMNRNLYKERDLVAAAHTLVGKHPSVNHKDDFWLSPDNPHNRWGVVTVVAAKPEDGAVEAILQVPKEAKCPVCNGASLTSLIDAKRIYNVSLEGQCNGKDGNGDCDGFEFTEKGFTLLTSDVLPGIPMSKIYPIESFLFIAPKKTGSKCVQIRGLTTTTKEGELSGMANPADYNKKNVQPDDNGQCPQGMMWSARELACVPIEDGNASLMFDTTPGGNKANSDLRRPRASTGRQQFTPEGTKVVLDQGNSAGKWHRAGAWKETDAVSNDAIPNQAMGNPGGCRQSDVDIMSEPMPNGDGSGNLPDRPSMDGANYGVSGTKAREGFGDASFPDSCFMYVPDSAKGPNGAKSDRKLPVKTADGKWDLPHVRNALARLNQTQGIPDATKAHIKATLQKVLDHQNECNAPGAMGALAGKTNVIQDAGNNDKFHPDNDDQWMLERGGVGTFDGEKGMKKGAPENTDILDRPNPTTKNDNQPAYVGHDACPNGMVWSDSDGMCVYDDPANESRFNSTGPCRKGQAYDAHEGKCVDVDEGPNIFNEPDTANDAMGRPMKPPVDQPATDRMVNGECPAGFKFDSDTGQCEIDAAQTEGSLKHGDLKQFTDMAAGHDQSKVKTYNPSSPTSDVRHGQPLDARGAASCRDGMVWDSRKGMCVVASDQNEGIGKTDLVGMTPKLHKFISNSPTPECDTGMVWNDRLGMCVPTDDAGHTGDRSNVANNMEASDTKGPCPPGMKMDPETGVCVDANLECRTAGTMGDLAGKTNVIQDAGNNDKFHPDNDDQWLIEQERRRLEEPFADYKNFADCMAKNKGKDDPAAYCGSIKAQTERHTANHELELSQALSRAASLEAQLAQEHVQHDATVKGLKAMVAKHWNSYQVEREVRMQLDGRLKELSKTVDTHEDRSRTANNERVELETKLSRRERDLQEALENSKKFKELYEGITNEHAQTEAKYREALTTNLALNKQITKANEDYLKLAREKEAIEEALKHAQRMAKNIVVKTRI